MLHNTNEQKGDMILDKPYLPLTHQPSPAPEYLTFLEHLPISSPMTPVLLHKLIFSVCPERSARVTKGNMLELGRQPGCESHLPHLTVNVPTHTRGGLSLSTERG